jgi:hypothetical protein
MPKPLAICCCLHVVGTPFVRHPACPVHSGGEPGKVHVRVVP